MCGERNPQKTSTGKQKFETLVAKVGEAIVSLKELRMALISAVVTGKMDVREASA